MQVELVSAATVDGIKLHGALHPATGASSCDVDAVLMLHGTGSNFYSSSLWSGLIPRLAEVGLPTLAVNTRGHDLATAVHALGQRRMIGAAYEKVEECRHDVRAWLDLLASRGLTRIALLGHSMGGLKAIYSQAVDPHPNVTCVLAVSAPRLVYSVFVASPQSAVFQHDLAQAESLVAAGQPEALLNVTFPIPYTITAAGYVDKYGREERYDLLKHAPHVRVPLLFTFGQRELRGAAFAGMPERWEALAAQTGLPLAVEVIADGDHVYTGCHNELAARVIRWLKKITK